MHISRDKTKELRWRKAHSLENMLSIDDLYTCVYTLIRFFRMSVRTHDFTLRSI
jgi:hypothetical protein